MGAATVILTVIFLVAMLSSFCPFAAILIKCWGIGLGWVFDNV
jgi:hypothetical protein